MNTNINGTWQNNMSEVRKLCIMHKECKDCPLVGYKPLRTNSGNIYCETGRYKKE